MADERLVITEAGFLTEFLNQHFQRIDRPFCFVLGAGVSKSSGIPTGGELADVWLREIFEAESFDGLALHDWATPERLGIAGFAVDKLGVFYPQLYRRRFFDHEEAGYAFLESQMDGKEPSYGYSVLAYLLSETPHRVVVTTNFDNLVSDALSIHSNHFPLVVSHESLAQYAAVELRRPLVAKIHGALGFAPKSRPDEIADLSDGWRAALQRICERYTPVVIGYEGNDGSLMSFLRSLPENVPDRVLWCVYAPGLKPSDCMKRVAPEVVDYVRARRGRFIPIGGFDELMAKLLVRLREKGSVPDLYERLKQRARLREQSYDDQQRRLFEASVSPRPDESVSASSLPEGDTSLSAAVSEIAVGRRIKPWWVWSKEAMEAPVTEKEKTYLRALEALPENPELLERYASFLERDGRLDEAEEFHDRALRANPNHALNLAFYAGFLKRRGKIDKAEDYFRRSLELEPEDSYTLTAYADLLIGAREEWDSAEALLLRAIAATPRYAFALGTYAIFLQLVRKDMDKAEEYFVKTVDANPQEVYYLKKYAEFLRDVRMDNEKAAEVDRRVESIEKGMADPN